MSELKMVKKSKLRKGQAFSTDILVVIVVILFGVLFLVMNKINMVQSDNVNQVYTQAAAESKLIVDNMKAKDILGNENQVNVQQILSLNEKQLKQELGLKNDFAIVFEKDGKLVKLDPENNINCIGSANIIVNGQACN